jgi:hypothetical protein
MYQPTRTRTRTSHTHHTRTTPSHILIFTPTPHSHPPIHTYPMLRPEPPTQLLKPLLAMHWTGCSCCTAAANASCRCEPSCGVRTLRPGRCTRCASAPAPRSPAAACPRRGCCRSAPAAVAATRGGCRTTAISGVYDVRTRCASSGSSLRGRDTAAAAAAYKATPGVGRRHWHVCSSRRGATRRLLAR